MKHLWNKTYQGTDIDAIRISADSEGVATTGRRSYNYRVRLVLASTCSRVTYGHGCRW